MSVLERINRKIDNMSAMLTRFGIDPVSFARRQAGVSFAAALRACQACPSGDLCRVWLDGSPERISRIPEFCPNALRFEQSKALMANDRTLH